MVPALWPLTIHTTHIERKPKGENMDKKIASVHPRKLARSMAKAMIGSNKIGSYDWRGLAAEAAKPGKKKGARK